MNLGRIARRLKNLVMKRSAYRFLMRDWCSLGDLHRLADAVATWRHSVNLEPVVMEAPGANRILVIAPHPDDEMIGPGGTLIQAIRRGAQVQVLYLSKGKASQAEQVLSETRAVAETLGYTTRFLDYYSRAIPLDEVIISELASTIESFSPGIVMLPFLADDHDDHRRASHLLWLASQRLRQISKIQIWAYQVYTSLIPNVVVDITDVIDDKRNAIGRWKTQAESRDWAHFASGVNAMNSRLLPDSVIPRYAEAFFVVPAEEYDDLCRTYFSGDPSGIYYAKTYAAGRSD